MMRRSLQRYFNIYRGLPAPIWILTLAIFINRCGTMVIPFLALYLTQILQVSVQTTGLIVSSYGLGAFCGAFLGGILSDRWGSTRVQIIALLASAICLLILQHISQPWSFAGILFLFGVMGDGYRPANSAAVALFSPPKVRARAFVLNRLGLNAGMGIGNTVGGALAGISYGLLFQVDAWTCVAAALIILVYFRGERGIPRTHEATGLIPPQMAKRRHLWVIVGVLLINTFACVQLFSTFPIFLKEVYRLSEFQYGQLMALNCFVILFCEMAVVHFFQKRSLMLAVCLGTLLTGLSFVLLPLQSGFFWAMAVVTVFTLGEMMSISILFSMIADHAPAKAIGRTMALGSASFSFMFMAAPPISTWIYAHWGPTTLWYVVGVLGACGALLARRIPANRTT